MLKITKIMLWVIFFSYALVGLHFFMHNQGGASLYLPFNMVGWIFIVLSISTGLWCLTVTENVIMPFQLKWQLLGFLVLLVPFLNADSQWAVDAEPRFLALVASLLLFFSLSQFQFDRLERHNILYILLIGIAIEVVFGLVQYFFLKSGNWFGYDIALNRPYGIFQQVNVYASFLATGLALSLYLIRWDKNFIASRLKCLLLFFLLVSTPFLLVIIQSRAGAVGAFLAISCLLPVLWFYNKKLFFIVITLLLIGFVFGFNVNSLNRTVDNYVTSTDMRKLYWSHVIDMWKATPWLGHGYGSFEYTFLHDYYAPENITPGMRFIEENLDHPHNEFLFWLHEGGLLAVIGLLIIAIGYIRSLLKCSGLSKRISLLALLLPIFFHSMVEYPFYHSVAHLFFFVIILWLADAESGQQKVIDCKYWFLARMLALFIPLLVVPFMLTGLQAASVLTKYDRMKDKNPQMLDEIINPLPWMNLYEFQMRSAQLTFSAAMHDKAGLESFVDWAKGFLHDTPRAAVYAQLVFALEQLNNTDQARQWLAEGKRLFPKATFLQKKQLALNPSTSGAK